MKPIMIKVELIDHEKTGLMVRVKRRELGVPLSILGKRVGLSASYLSELERGDRAWSDELFQKVWGALR